MIVTRCGLTLCPLAIGAHLQTRRMLVSPGRSSGPVAVLKIPPRSCLALELPGLLVSESVQPRLPRFGQLRSATGAFRGWPVRGVRRCWFISTVAEKSCQHIRRDFAKKKGTEVPIFYTSLKLLGEFTGHIPQVGLNLIKILIRAAIHNHRKVI